VHCEGSASCAPRGHVHLRNTELYATVQILVAFRGTQVEEAKDVGIDLKCWYYNGFHTDSDNPADTHQGFTQAMRASAPRIEAIVRMCTGGEAGWTVSLTGHSMGGALAMLLGHKLARCMPCSMTSPTLQSEPYELWARASPAATERATSCAGWHCATQLTASERLLCNAAQSTRSVSLRCLPRRGVHRVEVTTFGCPRTGNRAFAREFERVVPHHWRVVNERDIVPIAMPVGLGYKHAANGVLLTDGNQLGLLHAQAVDVSGLGVPHGMEQQVCHLDTIMKAVLRTQTLAREPTCSEGMQCAAVAGMQLCTLMQAAVSRAFSA
jgi:Lipase (class 3)